MKTVKEKHQWYKLEESLKDSPTMISEAALIALAKYFFAAGVDYAIDGNDPENYHHSVEDEFRDAWLTYIQGVK